MLPTAMPTSASTPVNTRVMPIDVLTPPPTTTVTPIPDEGRALVVGIVDGHTVLVVMEGDSPNQVYAVKHLGIEAPPLDDPWGAVARESNRKLIHLKVVRLVRDETDFDDEGFLYRYVYLDDQLLSVLLAEQGLAQAAVNPPDTRFENRILQAEAQAKEGKLGLWSGVPPTPTSTAVVEIEESAVITEATPLTIEATITPSGTVTTSSESVITSTVTVTPTSTVERSNSQ
jgi:micrococcal nuclease